MHATRRLVITGRVQGVGYRHAMIRKATGLALDGWVRNRPDGTVEAVVHGDADAVAAMLAWARHGPRSARVDSIEIEPAEGDFSGFAARPTG